MRRHVLALILASAAVVNLIEMPVARACGCLSPPLPSVTQSDYTVNQSSEQIIFEVEPGWVTAHVLIRYAGDPAQFGWLVPVPEVPTLALSPVSAFALLDQATAPALQLNTNDLCPQSPWACHYDQPSGGAGCGGTAANASYGAGVEDAGAFASDAAPGGTPPVTVINQQTIGDYQTVTFTASNAAAATQWLSDNGFIVNPTTTIYMESYIQANMVFVAAKLVPGAGVSAIKPLKMRYRAAYPSIPLILTAVAAQPHLTITSFIFSNQAFRPMGYPVVTIPANRLAIDPAGRNNYPMVLARTVDEAGGNGFAIEYRGGANPSPFVNSPSPCCTGQYDFCGVANDGQCECPGSPIDQTDCAADGDLIDGVALLQTLATAYTTLTRITTRLSPEQMTFDPTFEPDYNAPFTGALTLSNTQASLANCGGSVIDKPAYAQVLANEGCSAMYCGIGSKCVITTGGPACQCNVNSVAQQFTDLDGQPSVTCVPTVPVVNLGANTTLPDACANVTCNEGKCLNRNGIAVCSCNQNTAAVAGATEPSCYPVTAPSQSPGAEDFSQPLHDLGVCTPPPPSCYDNEQYDYVGAVNVGIDCGNATPTSSQQYGEGPDGCQESRTPPPLAFVGGAFLVLGLILRRRRA